ncbi:MAG TPA: FliO/MopB family protein [Firmicutes bacterium]|nr:FliO/MopB family protein [Bacillota bacterium]
MGGFLLVLRTIVSLGLVIGLIYFTIYILRYFASRGHGKLLAGRARSMALIESLALEPGKALHLVRVGKEVMLIGTSNAGLELLGKVEGYGDSDSQV